MSQSQDEKDGMGSHQNSEWEDSLDANSHAMLTHADTLIHGNDSEVIRRFLVTKDKPLFATGTTTKYLEVLYDGSVRIRDVKKSTYSDPIREPWDIFKKNIEGIKKKNKKNIGSDHNSHKSNKNNAESKSDKLKIYMDGKSKKRYFKFSVLKEKTEFFNLIEELRKKKDRSTKKQKYSSEPFIFAPYEVVGFFIRNAIVQRQGSTIKHRDKLIAITNFRIVVVDPDQPNIINKQNDDDHVMIDENAQNNAPHRPSAYNNPLDQSSSYKQNKLTRGDHIVPALTVPHHSVYEYSVDGDQITLETKDYRTITINLSNITNTTLRTQSVFMMKRYLLPTDEKDIFAFSGYFSVTRTKTPSHSEADISQLKGFPDLNKMSMKVELNGVGSSFMSSSASSSHGNSQTLVNISSAYNNASMEDKNHLYAQLKDSRYHISHTIELMKKEYRRLGWKENDKNCPFRVTTLNENYSLCSTYPRLLLVPQNAKDMLIQKAAAHRSRNRLPVITWSNSYNISLARSSQPQAGVSHKRNEYDERLLLLLNEMNSYSETFVICDCRPRVNAIANQYMKGKGFESGDNYEKAHIIFFDIQNIHQMRSSVNALKKCCEDQFDSAWLKNLHETQWFQHITKIIQCSRRCANMIDKDKYSVLVHCSDGWDRTAQVCALAELLLDPYYRTFDGFLILVQKEWLWFGHKFSDRNANFNGNTDGKHSSKHSNNDNHLSRSKQKERSPIFLQFLDCTFQCMMQFPWAFDFTQDLLLEFALHCNSGRFGDFFCNSMKERDEQDLWLKTASLFKYLNALWKLGRFRNPDYIPTKTVLRPRYAVRDMILWDEVYCRFTMHDKDRHSSSLYTYNMDRNRIKNKQQQHTSSSSATAYDNNTNTTNSGKNRYHPRSPRISSKMFVNKKLQQKQSKNHDTSSPVLGPLNNSFIDDDDNNASTPRRRTNTQRSKPKPPPPPKSKSKQKLNALAPSDTTPINNNDTGCVYNSDLESNNNKNGPLPPIAITDDDDDGVGDGYRSSDSDSETIPEEVKRITLLQKKVRELESIIKEYRNRENNDDDDPINIGTPSVSDYNQQINTPTTDYKKTNKSKGNIV